MKKEQRRVFVELTAIVDTWLCDFCKYTECECGTSPCDCGDPYCVHPLKDRLPEQEYGAPYFDCWGFRPRLDISMCADMVGIILQRGWNEWVYWQNKKGIWKITGDTLSLQAPKATARSNSTGV